MINVAITTAPHRDKGHLERALDSLLGQGVVVTVLDSRDDHFNKWNRILGWSENEKYLTLAHDDDLYKPAWAETLEGCLESHPQLAAVFCLHNEFRSDVEWPYDEAEWLPAFRAMGVDDIWRETIKRRHIICSQSGVMRMEICRGLRFRREFGMAADKDFMFQIAERGPVGMIPRRLFSYRLGSPEGFDKLAKDPRENLKWIEVLKHWADRYPSVVSDEVGCLWEHLKAAYSILTNPDREERNG